MGRKSTFRKRFLNGDELIGIFVKTPHHAGVEVLGATDLDFLVLDQEHSPFDWHAVDSCLLAANAMDMPTFVRIQQNTATGMLGPLDLGAAGVIVPHVATREKAEEIALGGRYAGGRRGFAGTNRAGGYGTKGMSDYIEEADSQTTVIAQIEDVDAIKNIEEIVAVPNIDGIFLGRADLTVGFGAETPSDTVVVDAVRHVCGVARDAGMPIAAYAKVAEIDMLRDLGVTMFTVGSEHSLLQSGSKQILESFK